MVTRTVLLAHRLADGSEHFDWLIERPDAQHERCLLSFRCDRRVDRWIIDQPSGSSSHGLLVETMPDHRAAFLTCEGPLSPAPDGSSRGSVRRVAQGTFAWQAPEPGDASSAIRARVAFEATAAFDVLIEPDADPRLWRVRLI